MGMIKDFQSAIQEQVKETELFIECLCDGDLQTVTTVTAPLARELVNLVFTVGDIQRMFENDILFWQVRYNNDDGVMDQ